MKTHMQKNAEEPFVGFGTPLCGRSDTGTTTNPAWVTCKVCLRLMNKANAAAEGK